MRKTVLKGKIRVLRKMVFFCRSHLGQQLASARQRVKRRRYFRWREVGQEFLLQALKVCASPQVHHPVSDSENSDFVRTPLVSP